MAQGKAFTPQERENILESIRPYLQMGDSVNVACISAGVNPQTVYKWLENDETLWNKIKSWQNMVNAIAKQNLIKSIQGVKDKDGKWEIEPNTEDAKWWLERKEKKVFGRNLDITTDNEKLNGEVKVVFEDFSDNEQDNEIQGS